MTINLPRGRKKYNRLGKYAARMFKDYVSGMAVKDIAVKYFSNPVSVRRAIRRHEPNVNFKKAQYVDETGKTYGRLKVLRYVGSFLEGRNRPAYFLCLCTCGGEVIRAGYVLRFGQTVSCGCKRSAAPFGRKVIKKLDVREVLTLYTINKGVNL